MPMNLERLEMLRQLAERQEQAALKQLAQRQQQLARAEGVLRELEQYSQSDTLRPAAVSNSALLLNQQAFVQRLQQAIASQAGTVRAAVVAVETARQHWLAEKRQLMVAEQMCRQARLALQQRQAYRAQLESDEVAAQRWVQASHA